MIRAFCLRHPETVFRMPTTHRSTAYIPFLLAWGILGCGTSPDPTKPSAITASSTAPSPQPTIPLLDIEDAAALGKWLESKQGKIMVVDYWATWCPPCVKEFPELVKIHQQHSDHVTCVSVSCDNEGLDELASVRSRVKSFLEKRQATFDNLLVLQESDAFFKAKGIPSVPIVEVYGADGHLVQRFDGAKAAGPIYESVHQVIESLLNSK